MTNFFQQIASLGSSVFTDNTETKNTTPKEELGVIGVDTNSIDEQVSKEIETSNLNKLSLDEYYTKLDKLKELNPDMSDDEIWDTGLKLSKKKGYQIEGINIDEELGIDETKEELEQVNITPREDEPGFISNAGEGLTTFKEGTENVIGGAIANIPNILGNTFGFVADVLTPKQLEGLGDAFREGGIKDQKQLQNMLGVEPETFATSAGEFGSDIGTLFIPGGQTKLVAKFPQAADKISQLGTAINNISQKSPKVYKILKSALSGSKEVGKFEAITEGEVTPTGLAVGAVANPAIDKAGKIISNAIGKDVISSLGAVFSPVKKKGVTTKQVKDDLASIAGTLKSRSLKPNDLEELYKGLSQAQKDIYNNGIKPKLQAAGEKGSTINMTFEVDNVLKDLTGKGKVAGVDVSKLTGKGKEINELKDLTSAWKTGDTDILDVEQLKQLSSALVRENRGAGKDALLNSTQLEFFTKLDTKLQDAIESKLLKVGGEGVKALKKEYGAIARQLPSLDAKILREMKKEGVSLFEGLGIISGLKDIVSGNIASGGTSILTGKILNLLKDPDEILKRLIKDLNKTGKSNIRGKLTPVMTAEGVDKVTEILE